MTAPLSTRAADFHTIQAVTSATQDLDYYKCEGLIEGPDIGFESVAPFNRLSSTTWVTDAPYGYPSNYFEPVPDPAPKLIFDLGSNVGVAEVSTWGYSTGIEGNSMKDFSLRFATDAEGPDAAGTSITFNPTFSMGPQISPRQSFMLGRLVTARYVELTPLNNNIGLGPGGDRVGFGEAAFESFPVVAGSSVDLPTELTLGDSSFVKPFDLAVRNVGQQPLTLTSPTFTGAGAAAFSVLQLPASIPAYSSAVIKLQFNPVGLSAGAVTAVFRVNTNTVGKPTVETALTAGVPAEAADQFYPIAGATSTTDATDYFKVAGLIGGVGVGFASEQPHAQPDGAALWVTDAPNGGTGDYFDPLPDPAPVLMLDLGANVALGEISIWGYSAGNANGASDFKLRFGTAAEGAAGVGTSITYNPLFTAAFGATDRQSFDLSQVVTARYVEVTPTDNYYGSGLAPGGDRVGFGEAAFEKIITTTGKNLIFPTETSFGTVSKNKTFTLVLKNYGTETVTISSRTLGGANASAFSIKSAPASLPPVSHGVVELEFNAAAATLGPQEATLQITSNDTKHPNAVILITGEFVNLPDTFYPITAVTSETEGSDYYAAINLIQGIGVGFGAEQPHDQLTDLTWVTNAPNGSVNYFDPAPEPSALLTFDLGADVALSEISIWGYSVGNSNGMRDFSLTFATSSEGPTGAGTSITYNPQFTAQFGNVIRNSFVFDRKVTAQYVVLKPLNNWGTEGVAPGGDRVGIGEVAFQIGAEIPAGDFAISSVTRNAQGQMQLSFGSREGSAYTVLRSLNLKDWTAVSTALPGTAGQMSFTDTTPVPAGTKALFYRVSRTGGG